MVKTKKKIIKASNVQIKKKRGPYSTSQYTLDVLKKALMEIKSGALSINKAAFVYTIPKGTLVNKLHAGTCSINKRGPAPILSNNEEARIKQWIIDKANIGYAMHPSIVKTAIKNVLDKAPRPNPFKNNFPGDKWFKLFLKRHPEIGLKHAEVLSKSRASVTEQDVRKWFSDFQDYLRKEDALDILENPSRIYNLDETGVQLCPKTGKLLGLKKQKNMYYVSPGQDKENITVLCCYSACGKEVAPMIVYPYKRFPPKDVAASVPNMFVIGHSPSGWMNIELYNSYIMNGFYKCLVDRQVQFPVILLFDGHRSHISLELHEFCTQKGIILYLLYPNATHLIQPCDVGIFKPLKTAWKLQVSLHAQNSNKAISKINFAPIFYIAHKQACTPQIIQKAFESCGLYPFNPDRVDYTKCMPDRHNNIKKASYGSDVDSSNENLENFMLVNMEENIPLDVLNKFQEAYQTKTYPAQEIILFTIWKTYKDSVLHEPVDSINSKCTSEPNVANINSTPVISINLDVDDSSNTLANKNCNFDNDILNKHNVEESVIINVPEEDNVQIVLENQMELLKEPSNQYVNLSDLPIIFAEVINKLPRNDEKELAATVNLSSNNTSNITPMTTEKNTSFTSLVSSASVNTPAEIVDHADKRNSELEILWNKELHFPQIVNPKKIKIKKTYNCAIASKEWKEEEEIKIKKQNEMQRQKELRKYEREIKKKIKLEEDELKKEEKDKKKKIALEKKWNKRKKEMKKTHKLLFLYQKKPKY